MTDYGKMYWGEAIGQFFAATHIAPPDLTNYSHNKGKSGDGGSKVADYFVCRGDIRGEARIVLPPPVLKGAGTRAAFPNQSGEEWFTNRVSDHVPVVATMVWG